ncbi:MAG: iron-containing alcohol dehydrogenase [Dehalococcoidia bacterium]|nr:MAG: iron-containing alcohol dehydrogenase [Dehalococcoidia bacterium]
MTGFNDRVEEYSLPPNICFGTGAADKVGELAKGIAKNMNAVIITDQVLVKLGTIDAPKKSLEKAGFKVDVCDSESAEPVIAEAKRIIDIVRGKDYGVVIGIGGGSAMDKSKLAAIMAVTPDDVEEYLLPSEKPLKGALPKIMIPTTSGTGSECSSFAVVSTPHKEQGSVKNFIGANEAMADVAIVDPSLVTGLPPKPTASSGMDAMSHNAEGVISLQANPLSDGLALKAVELVSQNLRTAVQQGNNIEARWNMALAASMGGIVITFPGVAGPATLGHTASESMSSRYGIPHGEACGVLLPFVYWFNLPDAYGSKKVTKIAEAMGEDVAGLTAKAAAEKAITATFNLLEEVGLPTGLKAYNIPKSDIPSISDFVLNRAENLYGMADFNPVKANTKNLTEFFERAFEGRESINL